MSFKTIVSTKVSTIALHTLDTTLDCIRCSRCTFGVCDFPSVRNLPRGGKLSPSPTRPHYGSRWTRNPYAITCRGLRRSKEHAILLYVRIVINARVTVCPRRRQPEDSVRVHDRHRPAVVPRSPDAQVQEVAESGETVQRFPGQVGGQPPRLGRVRDQRGVQAAVRDEVSATTAIADGRQVG